MYQPRATLSVETTLEPTQAAPAISPCRCDGEAGSGSDGYVPSRSPAASVEANLRALGGTLPTSKSIEADGAATSIKRRKDRRAGRISPIIAKVENIGSPETLVRLWDSCRASRARDQSIVSGTRQILPVEPEGDLDGPSVLERLESLKEQAAATSSSIHFSIAVKRYHHTQMVHLYNRARDLDETTIEVADPGSASQSLVDQFAERLFPSASAAEKQAGQGPKLKRKPLKSAFNRWLTLGNKLATLVARQHPSPHSSASQSGHMGYPARGENWLETYTSASQVRKLASEPMFLGGLLSWCAGAESDLDLLTQPARHSATEQRDSTADADSLPFDADD
ncbi:uncharacterized protein BDZ83DRAFT_656610 [Colletotrichum acutatum]|uniref:Uncharacterized protein n=1 Tax=Glomerella acutata TaxID=27357 RepID=A0AAD8XD12_GLOAC|nr:uncharacterized protein BDZ83DRAFT_656610 [Colletotrichum acutatum]KAK1712232.1 hypothetical protein BDZ83DRAFT_656610 [Colletotrichum acutatum]